MIPALLSGADYGLLALRVALGAILMAHGLPKLKHLSATADEFRNMGFLPGRLWAFIAGFIETISGALLIVGLFTQIAALIVTCQFLVIIVKLKLKKSLIGGYEFDLLIFASALALATIGAGEAMSLDETFRILIY
jgi:putative oxidoreductase